MRTLLVVLCMLLLGLVQIGLAAETPTAPAKMTPEEIRAVCTQIDAKCAEATKFLQEMAAFKAQLMQQLGEGAPPPTPPSKTAWAEKVSIGGYFHTRWEHFESGPPGTDNFAIRRGYLNFAFKPNDRTQVGLLLTREGSNAVTVNWANIFADYKLDDYSNIRFGRSSTTFGWDAAQSSSQRLPLERACFDEGGTNGSRGKPPGLFFIGPYDTGFWYYYTPKDNATFPQLILSATNGEGLGTPANDHIATQIDLKWRPKWGQFGVSYLDAVYTGPDPYFIGTPVPNVSWARNGVEGYVRYAQPSFATQWEYLKGNLGGHGMNGWYGQLEVPLQSTPGTFYARYQQYEPNEDDPLGLDNYDAWDLGYAHQLDRNNRLTLQITSASRGSAGRDETGFQWQAGF